MEKEEMRTQVRAMVDSLFSEKKESEIRKKTEEALGKSAETISNLTSTLEDKSAEIAEFETKLAESEINVQSLEKELEAAQKETETSKSLLKEREQALEDMVKAKAANERMAVLEEAGVARAEKEIQLAKIKEMSDEEFTSYKEELVYVRSAVEAELEKANKIKEEEDVKVAEALKKKEEEDQGSEKAEENKGTTPAKIAPGQAVAAAMNMEYMPNSDLMAKYAKLGEALAVKWKEESR